MPTRISPLLSSMLYALRRASSVDTSAFGEFEPSLVRKIGSVPSVASNRAWMFAGVTVQPCSAGGSSRRRGHWFPGSGRTDPSVDLAAVLNVAATPVGLANAACSAGKTALLLCRSADDEQCGKHDGQMATLESVIHHATSYE